MAGASARIKALVKSTLAKAGVGVSNIQGRYSQDGLFTIHSDRFRNDPVFRYAYNRGVEASQGFDSGFEWRIHVALWAAKTALHVAGDFVECGVNAGFTSSAIMQKLEWDRTGRRFYLIDTFAGPVLTQYSQQGNRSVQFAERGLAAGAYVTDLDRVRKNFAEWENVRIVQGTVPEILETIEFGAVAFLHIDMNCALPERTALEFFWDRLSAGAIVLFDDYTYYGHDYQQDALDSFATAKGIEILSLPTGQGLLVR